MLRAHAALHSPSPAPSDPPLPHQAQVGTAVLLNSLASDPTRRWDRAVTSSWARLIPLAGVLGSVHVVENGTPRVLPHPPICSLPVVPGRADATPASQFRFLWIYTQEGGAAPRCFWFNVGGTSLLFSIMAAGIPIPPVCTRLPFCLHPGQRLVSCCFRNSHSNRCEGQLSAVLICISLTTSVVQHLFRTCWPLGLFVGKCSSKSFVQSVPGRLGRGLFGFMSPGGLWMVTDPLSVLLDSFQTSANVWTFRCRA